MKNMLLTFVDVRVRNDLMKTRELGHDMTGQPWKVLENVYDMIAAHEDYRFHVGRVSC